MPHNSFVSSFQLLHVCVHASNWTCSSHKSVPSPTTTSWPLFSSLMWDHRKNGHVCFPCCLFKRKYEQGVFFSFHPPITTPLLSSHSLHPTKFTPTLRNLSPSLV